MIDNNTSSESNSQNESSTADQPVNRRVLMIVFLVVFIDLLGFGIVLPLLPLFAETYLKEIWGVAALGPLQGVILGLLMSSFSAMQFLFSPIWGKASDRFGRRPILLIGLVGSVVFYALFGFASNLPVDVAVMALVLLFSARIGQGIAGATIPTAQAAIADSTPPEKRKVGMAMIGAAFGIGFTFGPLIGFACLTFFPDYPGSLGFAAAGLSLTALILGLLLLPETRKYAQDSPRRKWISWRDTKEVFMMPTVGILILLFFLVTYGFASFEPTLVFINKEFLSLEQNHNFLVFAYVGLVLLLTQGFLYRRLAKRLSEETFMKIGIVLMGLGLALLGGMVLISSSPIKPIQVASSIGLLAPPSGQGPIQSVSALSALKMQTHSEWLSNLAGILFSLSVAVVGFAFLTPSVQSLISRRGDPQRQGEILGVNQSCSAMARILGPFSGMVLYWAHSSRLLPYAFAAVLILAMLPFLSRVRKREGANPQAGK